MRLIDADALIEAWRKKHNIGEDDYGAVFVGYSEIARLINKQPTIEPPTTTWLNPYSPYKCKHCGKHTDSKTPFCAWCGRKAENYD